jgi:hypothetical protein
MAQRSTGWRTQSDIAKLTSGQSVPPAVLLLSSNLRRRYAEDILTALATPAGGVVQFRYGSDYVAPSLLPWVGSGQVIGVRTLLAFIAEMESGSPFIVPVRLASVIRAESVADMFIFRLRVEEYANLHEYPFPEAEIRVHSKRLVDRLVESNGKYYPAVATFPDFGVDRKRDAAQAWFGVVRRLAHHPTFRRCYFLRVDDPTLQNGRPIQFDTVGRLPLTDRHSAKLSVTLFSQEYSDEGTKRLTCVTDGTFVRVSSDDAYDVALRYDTVEFWLQPRPSNFDALGRVTIELRQELPGNEAVATPTVRFPILVQRSRSLLAIRVATSAAGALMVALPTILGGTSALVLRVVVALAGAGLLSYSTIVMRREG